MTEKDKYPGKVANRLAGGAVLRQRIIRIEDKDWSLVEPAEIECPYCSKVNKRFLTSGEKEDSIRCSSCGKEIRIMARETEEDSSLEIPEEILNKLRQNTGFLKQNPFISWGADDAGPEDQDRRDQ